MRILGFWGALLLSLFAFAAAQAVVHSKTGDKVQTEGGDLTITAAGQVRGFGKDADKDINSPKSATFSHDGKKLYVNSLEGCKTVVYDAKTRKKLKTITHTFPSGEGPLWSKPSGYYPFTHYPEGQKKAFSGKPVEEALTPDGRYLFVPYYRRNFDLNAQDPSALAVIDTRTDEIIRMFETGPLPKMVRVSHDGKLLAITHWGDNTVGFLDISDKDPAKWHHRPPVTIGKKLNLHYSLTSPVNRDSGSGYLLRGTVFLPGDSLMLVSGMAGPLNVIDVKKMEWIGTFPDLGNVRHLTLHNGLLYLSRNSAGEVMTIPVENVVKAITSQRGSSRSFKTEGVRRVKVGGGARTLKVSPSGNYIFVACNTASGLYVVRTEDMKVIGHINADSFPVGLDVSPDGKTVVTTSQGRKGQGGGNAVDFFDVEYAVPEPVLEFTAPADDASEAAVAADQEQAAADEFQKDMEGHRKGWMLGCGIGIAVLAVVVVSTRKLRKGR